MAPVVAQIASENKNTFIVAKLNSFNNPTTSEKYQLDRIGHPAYLVFQDGEEVERFRGETPKAEFVQTVLDAIN